MITDLDFKVKGGFGPKGNDVSIFMHENTVRKTGQEPVSQPDPCHRYDGVKKLNSKEL